MAVQYYALHQEKIFLQRIQLSLTKKSGQWSIGSKLQTWQEESVSIAKKKKNVADKLFVYTL